MLDLPQRGWTPSTSLWCLGGPGEAVSPRLRRRNANLDTITALPVQGLHVDFVQVKTTSPAAQTSACRLPPSAGLVNGRDVGAPISSAVRAN
ncbi:hypothetical protein ACNKHK_24930 [Shigella flexneri]